jgi:hypothetical protein
MMEGLEVEAVVQLLLEAMVMLRLLGLVEMVVTDLATFFAQVLLKLVLVVVVEAFEVMKALAERVEQAVVVLVQVHRLLPLREQQTLAVAVVVQEVVLLQVQIYALVVVVALAS